MNKTKQLLPVMTAAIALTGSIYSGVATAEVAASAGVASTYLFRGVDSSGGNAEVFGDLTYSHETGIYAGIWGSSAGAGTQEYDLILGYSREIGQISIDLGVVNYIYPGNAGADEFWDSVEVYLGGAFAVNDELSLNVYYYDAIEGAEEYAYLSLGADYQKYSVVLGFAEDDDVVDSAYTHFDIGYAYNDNLSFTLSKVVDSDNDAMEDDTLFVVSYDLPIN